MASFGKSLIKAIGNKRILVALLLGFSSGLPLALTGTTLQAWMKSENVDLAVIGLFSLVGMPYALKFAWAPLLDRYVPPFLGRRRGWILIAQLFLVMCVFGMAFSSPASRPALTAGIALAIAFFSASQDIVVDAYRTEIIRTEELGPGAASYILGYRIAMLVSGAVALVLSDHLSWRTVYLLMAAGMGVGILTSIFAPEPEQQAPPPKTMVEAVVLPFVEFFKRPGAFEMLAFVILYKLDTVVATAMTTPFILELGFTKTDIGTVTKGFGLVATILGTLAGGTLMVRLGMLRSLWLFGILQGLAGFSFMVLAHVGHHYPMMVVAIAAENFFAGTGTAAYSAFMMEICDRRFTATQYALITSLMALTRVIGGAPTGYLVKALGWESYFLVSILVSIPGLLLLTRYPKWRGQNGALGIP